MDEQSAFKVEARIHAVLKAGGGREADIQKFMEQVRETECHDLYIAIETEDLLREFRLECPPKPKHRLHTKEFVGEHHCMVKCSGCGAIVIQDDARFGSFGPLTIPEPYCVLCVDAGKTDFADMSDNTFILKPRLR
jgi:hypothetical protein